MNIVEILGIRRWIKENSRKIELYGQYFKLYHFYFKKVLKIMFYDRLV